MLFIKNIYNKQLCYLLKMFFLQNKRRIETFNDKINYNKTIKTVKPLKITNKKNKDYLLFSIK